MATRDDGLESILRGHRTPQDIPDREAEKDADALSLKDMDGSATTMRPANKEIARLHVIDRKGNVRTFCYDHLDVRHEFSGGSFSLIFAGTKHWRIDMTGHGDLWRVFDYCTLRRWPYLRESERGFAAAGETVLTKIEIHDVTPKPES